MAARVRMSVLIFVLGLGVAARANALIEPGPELQRARAMRDAGVALTAIGLACEVVTIALWASWVVAVDENHSRYGEYGPGVPFDMAAGAIATSAAVPVLLGIGVPLWSVGARRQQRGAAVSISAAGVLRF